ncbi:MAG: PepSY domain-containing protein, partial [Gemmatimonadota bacterium]|nr:PepSY domain-containing protein [Gemmatimonadota bacterium]
MIRKALFWTHLVAGVSTGAIIIMMSATGVVLTYEAQWIRWAERQLDVGAQSDRASLGLREIRERAVLAGVEAHGSFAPRTVTLRPEPGSAVQVSDGGGQRVYLDPYDGTLLATGFPRLEAFLAAAKGWHRWFNVAQDDRRRGRAWTGVRS